MTGSSDTFHVSSMAIGGEGIKGKMASILFMQPFGKERMPRQCVDFKPLYYRTYSLVEPAWNERSRCLLIFSGYVFFPQTFFLFKPANFAGQQNAGFAPKGFIVPVQRAELLQRASLYWYNGPDLLRRA
jgi:hypothetical protein